MRTPLLTACLLLGATKAAAEDSTKSVDWSADAAIVSDYRWRGVSLTDNDPAIQGSVTAALASGFYVNAWGSLPTQSAGDEEIDLSAGYAFSIAGGDADVSVVQYIYPGLDGVDYTNFVALYAHPLGGWTLRGRLEYAPPQRNVWDESFYAALETEKPIGQTGFTFLASAGWEEGAFTLDGEKWDYSIGLGYQWGPAAFNLAYVDTDEKAPAGQGDVYGGGAVFSIGAAF
ncbi:MAG: TorF family putative porin [Caulobacterales bacterium]